MIIWIVMNIILFFLLPFYMVIFFKDVNSTRKFIVLNLACYLLLSAICAWKIKTLYSAILIIFGAALVYYIGTYFIYKARIDAKIDRDRLLSIWSNKSFGFMKIIIMVVSIAAFIGNVMLCKATFVNIESISLCLITLLGMIELVVGFNSKFISKA